MDADDLVLPETAPYVSFPSRAADRGPELAIVLFPIAMACLLLAFLFLRVQ
jgi:hypothetical protein